MSDLQRLKAAGAQCVGGDLFINRVVVATLRHGLCLVTPEGAEVLKKVDAKAAVEDAVVVSETPKVTPAPAPAVARRKGSAAAPAPTPAPTSAPVAPADLTDLDALLVTE